MTRLADVYVILYFFWTQLKKSNLNRNLFYLLNITISVPINILYITAYDMLSVNFLEILNFLKMQKYSQYKNYEQFQYKMLIIELDSE